MRYLVLWRTYAGMEAWTGDTSIHQVRDSGVVARGGCKILPAMVVVLACTLMRLPQPLLTVRIL
jgi:hypothetical protein